MIQWGLFVSLTLLAAPAFGMTFNVTKAANTDDGVCDSDCSLREAVNAANAVPADFDTVNVPSGIYDSTPGLTLNGNVAVVGTGSATTVIEGAPGDDSVFVHFNGSVHLSNLKIRASGRGLFATISSQSVEIDGCEFETSGYLPAFDFQGSPVSIDIDGTTFAGTIFVYSYVGGGTFAMHRSTVRSRTGPLIDLNLLASVLIDRSTITGSLADELYGMGGDGLHLNSEGTDFTLVNSTISGNAGNGLALNFNGTGDETVVLQSSTITENGAAGIFDPIDFVEKDFSNMILSANVGGNCSLVSGPTSLGYNLSDDSTCSFSGPGDQNIVYPLLAPLGDYGGPTQTHALCTGIGTPHVSCTGPSPALDAGNPAAPGSGGGACEADDQRGAVRPAGGRCDVGAYEYACGNGNVDFDEACDDGGQTDGDCCSATCAMPACVSGLKSSFSLSDKSDDSKDKLSWKWSNGNTANFGDPTATTDYHLCVWDDGALKLDALVDHDGDCSDGTCWSPKGTPVSAYGYKNRNGNAAGITSTKLKTTTGGASAQVKGKGTGLPLPGPVSPTRYFAQTSDVTVQLIGSDAPQCFEASFTSAAKNDGENFKGKTP